MYHHPMSDLASRWYERLPEFIVGWTFAFSVPGVGIVDV